MPQERPAGRTDSISGDPAVRADGYSADVAEQADGIGADPAVRADGYSADVAEQADGIGAGPAARADTIADPTAAVQHPPVMEVLADSAFRWAAEEDSLCEGNTQGVESDLADVPLCTNAYRRGAGRIKMFIGRACSAAESMAQPAWN